MWLFGPNVDKLASEGKIDELLECLDHRNGDVRFRAFYALYDKMDQEKIYDKLKTLVNDRDPRVKTAAILKFAHQGDPEIIGNLRTIIIQGSQKDKIEALRIIAEQNQGKISNESIPNIIALALQDRKMFVIKEALRAIGSIRDRIFLRHCEEKAHDERNQVRMEAVKAMGNIGGDEAVSPLIGALTDINKDVQRLARKALYNIGTERALKAIKDEPFQKLVNGMNGKLTGRLETIHQIVNLSIREAIPLLNKACSDKYKEIRVESARALSHFNDRSSIIYLAMLLNDFYYDVRLEAVKTLENIVDSETVEVLEKVLNDSNRHVREEATKAYHHIKSKLDKMPERDAQH